MSYSMLLSALLLTSISCAPVGQTPASQLDPASSKPIPGQSPLYSTYYGTAPPYPGNETTAIANTTTGPPGSDDELFQNLLSAEWIIFSFYQQGAEAFNQSSFTELGYLNTTYQSILEIRDNEAGHLAIFQDQISSTSVKPGPCQYEFPFTDPVSFIALQTIIEVSSMAFLTGLELQAELNPSRAALVAIAATESRHNTWSLIDNWAASPFAGPSDTVYPYANQILDFTNVWVVPGSCPTENPVYPNPRQNLPPTSVGTNSTGVLPGSTLQFNFTSPDNQPHFNGSQSQDFYAVFFHGVFNISVPFDTTTYEVTIPSEIEPAGIIIAVVADAEGAPTQESVLTSPLILPQSPPQLAAFVAGG